MSQELLQHLHHKVCDASNVLRNVQEDRDSQLNHLQVLMRHPHSVTRVVVSP